MGHRVVAVRHPMPYGDLTKQAVQRFAELADLERADCSIEEREEYEPLLEAGVTVFAGVDYERILHAAEQEADIIVWDGGNNDLPFFAPDLHIVVADARRPGHESTFHPGEANARAADVLVINKVDSATPEHIRAVFEGLRELNPRAVVIETASPINVTDPTAIRGQRALVIEDGPTLTHGGAPYGAGWLAAQRFGAAGVVDPRPYAVGSIRETFRAYPGIGPVLPAMGYGREMIADLEQTINAVRADVVLVGTPVDLGRFLRVNKTLIRVRYEMQECHSPTFEDVLSDRFAKAPAPVAQ
jgi:predicted GTPase